MDSNPDFQARLAEAANLVEHRLTSILDAGMAGGIPLRLAEAMRHATLGGGKRFRPFLIIEGARLFGRTPASVAHAAAAVECLHCYSLVHDDLPAMDDDELRRGRPTVWKAFGEANAILAGDGLLTLAFEILASPETHASAEVRAEMIAGLARAGGAAGMVGGQFLDLEAEAGNSAHHSLAGVAAIQSRKTGALIRFAAEAGAILAIAPAHERAALAAYGDAIGVAFQIADDLLDAEGDATTVGKGVAKDAAAGKATFVTLLGAGGARARLRQAEEQALAALVPFGARAATLAAAVYFVTGRQH